MDTPVSFILYEEVGAAQYVLFSGFRLALDWAAGNFQHSGMLLAHMCDKCGCQLAHMCDPRGYMSKCIELPAAGMQCFAACSNCCCIASDLWCCVSKCAVPTEVAVLRAPCKRQQPACMVLLDVQVLDECDEDKQNTCILMIP
jgi:hypothetical protein